MKELKIGEKLPINIINKEIETSPSIEIIEK